MRFIRRSIISADSLSQLFSSEQGIGLDNVTLAVDPLGLNGVEPGTFCRKIQGQDTHVFLFFPHFNIMQTNPGTHHFAHMPGGIIPNQQP